MDIYTLAKGAGHFNRLSDTSLSHSLRIPREDAVIIDCVFSSIMISYHSPPLFTHVGLSNTECNYWITDIQLTFSSLLMHNSDCVSLIHRNTIHACKNDR